MKMCDCKDWKPNVDIIDSALFLAFNHNERCAIKTFEFCPWCGKRLADVEMND